MRSLGQFHQPIACKAFHHIFIGSECVNHLHVGLSAILASLHPPSPLCCCPGGKAGGSGPVRGPAKRVKNSPGLNPGLTNSQRGWIFLGKPAALKILHEAGLGFAFSSSSKLWSGRVMGAGSPAGRTRLEPTADTAPRWAGAGNPCLFPSLMLKKFRLRGTGYWNADKECYGLMAAFQKPPDALGSQAL